jgi:hypothetical protein
VAYVHDKILFSYKKEQNQYVHMNKIKIKKKKEQNHVICRNTEETVDYHVKWNKPDAERQVPHIFLSHVESKKKKRDNMKEKGRPLEKRKEIKGREKRE